MIIKKIIQYILTGFVPLIFFILGCGALYFGLDPFIQSDKYVFSDDLRKVEIKIQTIQEYIEEDDNNRKTSRFIEILGDNNTYYVYLDTGYDYIGLNNNLFVGDTIEIDILHKELVKVTEDEKKIFYLYGVYKSEDFFITPYQNLGDMIFSWFNVCLGVIMGAAFFFSCYTYFVQIFFPPPSAIDYYIVLQDMYRGEGSQVGKGIPPYFLGFIVFWLIERNAVTHFIQLDEKRDLSQQLESGSLNFTYLIDYLSGNLYNTDFVDPLYIPFVTTYRQKLSEQNIIGKFSGKDDWQSYQKMKTFLDTAFIEYQREI